MNALASVMCVVSFKARAEHLGIGVAAPFVAALGAFLHGVIESRD